MYHDSKRVCVCVRQIVDKSEWLIDCNDYIYNVYFYSEVQINLDTKIS